MSSGSEIRGAPSVSGLAASGVGMVSVKDITGQARSQYIFNDITGKNISIILWCKPRDPAFAGEYLVPS